MIGQITRAHHSIAVDVRARDGTAVALRGMAVQVLLWHALIAAVFGEAARAMVERALQTSAQSLAQVRTRA